MNLRKKNAVSPVVGIAVLIAIAVILSALVFTTTSGFMTEQQAPSAGANVTIVSESVIQVQLDSVQNADNVYVQSPLGTRYKFDGIGDTVEILNVGNEQKPVVIAEKNGKEQVVQGITPRSFDADYVVSESGLTFSEALNKADSTENETIVIKRGEYSGDVDITKKSKIIAEHGTKIDGNVTVSESATFSNAEIVGGSINVDSTGVYLASNTSSVDATGYEDDVVIAESTNSLIREVGNTSSTQTTTVSNVAPSADLTFSPTSPVNGESVSFDGSASADEDGSIESYEWDFDGDGTTDVTGETVSHTFTSKGDYNVTLTVTDNDGDSGASTQQFSVDSSLTEGLVANYEFEGDVTDSANSYDGDDNTSSGYTNGPVGTQAKVFDGNDDYIGIGSPSSLDFTTSDTFTISTWANIHDISSSRNHLISTRSGNSNWVHIGTYTDGDLRFQVKGDSNGNYVEWKNTPTNEWVHLIGMYEADSHTVTLYANGNKIGSNSLDSMSGSFIGGDNWNLGRRQNSSWRFWYDGSLDDTRIYDRKLSQKEVQSLYDKGQFEPVAEFTHSPDSPDVGSSITFDASASSDRDGSVKSYSWDFDGDGQEDATGETASHTFNSSGDYEVTLTVTDDESKTGEATKTVSVSSKTVTFESGNLSSSWEINKDSSWSVESDGYNSTYALVGTNSGSENHGEIYNTEWGANSGTVSVSAMIKVDRGGLGNGDGSIIFGDGNCYSKTRFNPGGGSDSTFILSTCGGSFDGGGPTVKDNTWYEVEYVYDIDSSTQDAYLKKPDGTVLSHLSVQGGVSSGHVGFQMYKGANQSIDNVEVSITG